MKTFKALFIALAPFIPNFAISEAGVPINKIAENAKRGDAQSQCVLGLYYADGKEVRKDEVKAVFWVRLAAKQGYAKAQHFLGMFYTLGQGVPVDYVEAAKWIRLAAEQGDIHSQFALGMRYARGQGVPNDDDEALKWVSLAAANGIEEAKKAEVQLSERIITKKHADTPKRASVVPIQAREPKTESTRVIPFDSEATRSKAAKMKGRTLVFKGFYLGMPSEDALGLLNHYLQLPQVSNEPVPPSTNINPFTREDKGPYFIVKTPKEALVARVDFPDQPFARLDSSGKVIEFNVSKRNADELFGSKDLPFEEFIQTFCDSYDVPELTFGSEDLTDFGGTIGYQVCHAHRSDSGYEVKFFGEKTLVGSRKIVLSGGGEEGSIKIIGISAKSDRVRKFD